MAKRGGDAVAIRCSRRLRIDRQSDMPHHRHAGRSVSGGAPGGTPRDWRDASSYARLAGIDRAGVMWEWLRRDPDYVSWHIRASTATRGTGRSDGHCDPIRWGLHFRRASGPRCP